MAVFGEQLEGAWGSASSSPQWPANAQPPPALWPHPVPPLAASRWVAPRGSQVDLPHLPAPMGVTTSEMHPPAVGHFHKLVWCHFQVAVTCAAGSATHIWPSAPAPWAASASSGGPAQGPATAPVIAAASAAARASVRFIWPMAPAG